ncbi:MAG: RecQ family ATP-dependent DNA helicase [Xanthomonadales bacterium]|jgi:ATP-dependent DNA helicase RecQ|nr:RecQ family ATP-dependent DNA helicase [Xanthomonadales bacterium]
MIDATTALRHLRLAMADSLVQFRDGQWEAIDQIVNRRGRVLCVQRTGWGKSMVYFIAAKLLREQGHGVTLLISPLLSLMRNQIQAAERLGLRALTINSTNPADWRVVCKQLLADQADLLLISPERLANDEFVRETLLPIAARIGLLVVDEAHCISDWGHDFRPDYRRIGQVLARLPRNIAVLGTTATATQRVVADVAAQLGGAVQIQRGPLMRETLGLQAVRMPHPADRLAWLAERLPGLPGSGIVYVLTVRDADRVADWLQQQGIQAEAYHAEVEGDRREQLEQALLDNALKCLVATTALGMGFDKPDLGFVIHYQTPANVVAYYQQVGRAGRAIEAAVGVLLAGTEDAQIHHHFRERAFPPESQIGRILAALEAAEDGLTERELQQVANLRPALISKTLKLLSVEARSPVLLLERRWMRTPHPFVPDRERIALLARQREQEWQQMQRYLQGQRCLMQFLTEVLDDSGSAPCGRCAVCRGAPLVPVGVQPELRDAALRFLLRSERVLEPRKQWLPDSLPHYAAELAPLKPRIPPGWLAEPGRMLSRWGEPPVGLLVTEGKQAGCFNDLLVKASVQLLRKRWPEAAAVGWVTCVPSLRHPDLVPDFARRLAAALGLPFQPVVVKVRETEPQKQMENSFHQCHNLDGAFRINPVPPGRQPVLLVDDLVDSGWTFTLVAALLRRHGAGPVFPFALASSAAR